jgi:hypothetical protein
MTQNNAFASQINRSQLGLQKLGKIPLSVMQRNVSELCSSEWGTRELRWALQPITGMQAPEHEFMCMFSNNIVSENVIIVFKRGDKTKKVLFEISAAVDNFGLVLCKN